MTEFSSISWNIHRARGNDGRVDPVRTVDVLLSEVWRAGTDALILQEADEECPPHAGLLDIARIEAETGLRSIHHDPAHRWSSGSDGFLGNIVFLAPTLSVTALDLVDLPGHCHRGAVVAELVRGAVPFRLITTHLSLGQLLRLAQLRTISQFVFRKAPMPTVLIGDLNEWRPWGGLALSPRLLGTAFRGPVKPTFPINRPVLPLDRALATAPARVTEVSVLDGPGIRATSDHRPLVVRVDLGV